MTIQSVEYKTAVNFNLFILLNFKEISYFDLFILK